MTILLVGLGNPGSRYDRTRHNIGAALVERIAKNQNAKAWTTKYNGEKTEFSYTELGEPQKVVLLKPTTYMNRSGIAVANAKVGLRLQSNDIIIAHDELDLAVGKIRMKYAGGNAGHNGLKSTSGLISSDFWRLRIGIGRPDDGDVNRYVLGRPKPADAELLDVRLEQIVGLLPQLLARNLEKFNAAIGSL